MLPTMLHIKRAGATHLRRYLTQSAVQGPLDPPLSYKTLPQFFRTEIVETHGERPALICRKEARGSHGGPSSRNLGVSTHLAWDFHEFDTHINALARGLLVMGVQKGDRVGVIMGNNRCVCAGFTCYTYSEIMIAAHTPCFSGLVPALVLFW
jgi:acyl-CoA synthetase (AMP-forming)/AMP-acid ligase II